MELLVLHLFVNIIQEENNFVFLFLKKTRDNVRTKSRKFSTEMDSWTSKFVEEIKVPEIWTRLNNCDNEGQRKT
jgi:hypothetical protein